MFLQICNKNEKYRLLYLNKNNFMVIKTSGRKIFTISRPLNSMEENFI